MSLSTDEPSSSPEVSADQTAASLEVRASVFETPEGQRIETQSVGQGKPIVLCNGLGGTFDAWRHLYGALAHRYQVFSWYYRGLHGSSVGAPGRIRVVDQIDDLELLLEHWGIEEAVFIGWSMGVQVILELHRRARERIVAMAALNGGAGRLFDTVAPGRVNRYLLPPLMRVAARNGSLVSSVVRSITQWQGLMPTAKRLGVFAPTIDEEVFGDVIDAYGRLDFGLYADALRLLDEHDAWEVLPSIEVPTTIIAGERDLLTPAELSRQMAKQIPHASLVVIPGCTHFAAVERPDAVNEAIFELLQRARY